MHLSLGRKPDGPNSIQDAPTLMKMVIDSPSSNQVPDYKTQHHFSGRSTPILLTRPDKPQLLQLKKFVCFRSNHDKSIMQLTALFSIPFLATFTLAAPQGNVTPTCCSVNDCGSFCTASCTRPFCGLSVFG